MNRKYRKTVIAGNWKMNQLASGIKPFIEELKENLPKQKTCDIVLCTPAVMVPAMIKAGKEAKVAAGAQDVSKYEKGAYTGEVSADQLADPGRTVDQIGIEEHIQARDAGPVHNVVRAAAEDHTGALLRQLQHQLQFSL